MMIISVIIPALDDAEMLDRCLAALRRQTRRADEILVVDNGSVDATADVARGHGARVVDEPMRGIPAATAAGFDAATGTILARLDADSLPAEDWLARVEKHFQIDPGVAAVTGPGVFYGGSRLTHWIGRTLYIGGYFWFFSWLLGQTPLFGSNFALRSSAWAIMGRSFHRAIRDVHDDLDLSFQMGPELRVAYDTKLVVGISSRPFGTLGGLVRRVYWGFTTISLNLRERSLWDRRADRRAWESTHGAEAQVESV